MWQPIETAPKDRFLLLCGPSGYTTTPWVFATGCMYSDYHVGRWVDHANDDLSDWGFEPTHWMPLPELPGAQPAPSVPDGYKLVPIVSTAEMDNAGADHCDGYWNTAQAVWDAMLAVAPEAKP